MGPGIIWGLCIGYFAISAIIENLPEKYKVRRISKSGILKQKIELSEVNHLALDECLKFEENNDIVSEFYQTLEGNFSHCDLSSFYSNMASLKISSSNESFLLNLSTMLSGTVTGGAYSSKYNKIHIDESPLGRKSLKKDVLMHELLHMASTRKDKDTFFSGFHIRRKNVSIGEALNEGYTELLNGRYFCDGRKNNSYYELQMIASGIESIVGQGNMEQAYFINDLNSIVLELAKYSSVNHALELLVKIDSLLNKKYRSNPEKMVKFASEIRADIANIKLNKLKVQRETGEISESEYRDSVYAQELYVNGYVAFGKRNANGKIDNYFVADGPLMKYGYVEIESDEFNQYVSEYYEHFKDNGLSVKQPWKNKFDITTKKLIDTKFREKRKKLIEEIDNKLGIKGIINPNVGETFNVERIDDNTCNKKEQRLR